MPYFSNFSGCSTGFCTVSCSSRLTPSRPPMSSHVMLGTCTPAGARVASAWRCKARCRARRRRGLCSSALARAGTSLICAGYRKSSMAGRAPHLHHSLA